jgi:hypothetical protein
VKLLLNVLESSFRKIASQKKFEPDDSRDSRISIDSLQDAKQALKINLHEPCRESGLKAIDQERADHRGTLQRVLHVAHREIVLVSPYLSEALFARNHFFGRFLDKAIEEETLVSVITRPPDQQSLGFYQHLEERGINTLFHRTVHAKLYRECPELR